MVRIAVSGNSRRLCTALLHQGALRDSAWYAVLDAAQNAQATHRARDEGLHGRSLYAGRLGAMLDDVAPHLVALDPQSPFLEWWLQHWDRNYGILLQSPAAFETLRKHLRRFLIVRDETGGKYRFRFYDPRVLRHFLPAFTPDELRQFFGPIERYYTPTRHGDGMLSFRLDRDRLRVTRIDRAAQPA